MDAKQCSVTTEGKTEKYVLQKSLRIHKADAGCNEKRNRNTEKQSLLRQRTQGLLKTKAGPVEQRTSPATTTTSLTLNNKKQQSVSEGIRQ